MHNMYSDIGAHPERVSENVALQWPAILRYSSHSRGKALWIGAKNWTDENGQFWDYRVSRLGPRARDDESEFIPVESKLIARFEDTSVLVNGLASLDKIAVVDEIDPTLPADRALYQKYRSALGIETERWVYAYAHEVHDDYHVIRRKVTNTGNTDEDAEIELPGQSLEGVFIYNAHRWVGRLQGARHGSTAQVWGKFSMNDVVGDGHEEYPVDFTAIYLWAGFDPIFSSPSEYGGAGMDNLGSPMLRKLGWEAPGDTIGRLSSMSMQGRVVLHADESPTDHTYNPAHQPHTIGFLDNDETLTLPNQLQEDYYNLGILTRENPAIYPGGSSRMYPHWADRIEPRGTFWDPQNDASGGKAGGHSSTFGFGPYQMAFGDSIEIVEAEGVAGLSYAAATDIGVAFKELGLDDDLPIAYDANGDGIINTSPWNYDVYKNGSELLTKNQWVMTARDSLFQLMYRARDVWNASNGMTEYPILEPPRPPRRFEINARPRHIDLYWETMAGSPDPEQWEVYRTTSYVDNLPYQKIATLPGSTRAYDDTEVIRGIDYYYFLQAVGQSNPVDARGIEGTPGGLPLKSGRYFTQSYTAASLLRRPGSRANDFRIVPNPVNFAADASLRTVVGVNPTFSRVSFVDIPGECTITIYTETGEFINRIHHTTGGGITSWDLTTASRQPVVSGIYIVRVEDIASGDVDTKKLVVIR